MPSLATRRVASSGTVVKAPDNGAHQQHWSHQEEDGGETYYVALIDEAEAVDGDGPTFVASYTVVSIRKLQKMVKEV